MNYYKVKVVGETRIFDDDYVICANSKREVESDISTHYCGNDFSLATYVINEITEKEYLASDDRRKF